MKGVTFASAGAAPQVVDDLKKPTPGPGQLLVKSLWTAINPVDTYMSATGLLVVDWPLVLGVDAAGIVVEVGEDTKSKYDFKAGDEVCGCTRLGMTEYSTVQENFLMDAQVTIPKPKNISLVQAATLGVGIETASLALFGGLGIEVPPADSKQAPEERDEWVIILGGASSVGKFAIQLARCSGYKVIASCSSRSGDTVQALGASTFDYKASLEDQLDTVMKATSGNFSRIFDAAASGDPLIVKALFKATGSATKLFSTTNDWSGIGDFEGGKTHIVKLGEVGRPEAHELNDELESYIPVLVRLVEAGLVKPAEYELVGQEGFEDAIQAYDYQRSGAGGSRKVVVKLQST